MDKKTRIYIVMYNFPPIGIGRGIAWHYFATKFKKGGYDVKVLTVEPSENDPYYNTDKLNLIDKSLYDIIRIKDSKLYYKVYSKKRNNTQTTYKKEITLKEKIKNIIIKIYKVMTRIIFYPDRMIFWSKAVRKYLIKQNLNNEDIIISVGFPFSTHLEMTKLKRKTKCKVLLDYGDPWSFNPSTDTEPKWRRRFDYHKEKSILKDVDHVTVTTDKTYQLFKEKFGLGNITIIRQGVKNDEYIVKLKKREEDKIIIVYTGIFYKEIRDPSMFFKALKNVDSKIDFRVEIVIAGTIDSYFIDVINKLELNNMKNIEVKFLGNVGLNKCIELQSNADMLLFFSNKENIQVPGKLYEYLATDKPIISISYDIGETENIIKKHNRGVVILNGEKMQEEILDILNKYKEYHEIPGINTQRIKEYDWDNISDKMIKIIKGV